MDDPESIRAILSANIRRAVADRLRVETPNITQVQDALKETGRGTVAEMLKNERSLGIDKLGQWASELGVEPWQLVAPEMGKNLKDSPTQNPIGFEASEQELQIFRQIHALSDKNKQKILQLLQSAESVAVANITDTLKPKGHFGKRRTA